jgi:hypothetical protein
MDGAVLMPNETTGDEPYATPYASTPWHSVTSHEAG